MERAVEPRLVATDRFLAVTLRVQVGGVFTQHRYRLALADLREEDMEFLMRAWDIEVRRRLRERWGDALRDDPLF